jgi:hypothetical protein
MHSQFFQKNQCVTDKVVYKPDAHLVHIYDSSSLVEPVALWAKNLDLNDDGKCVNMTDVKIHARGLKTGISSYNIYQACCYVLLFSVI